MIIFLTGPTGAGKTDTSWALLKQFEHMIFLDCDWFASRVPFSWDNESDVETVFQALSLMIEFYVKQNENNFVVPLTLEMARFFKKYENYFLKHNLALKTFRLRCSAQELERRILARDRIHWQKHQELSSMIDTQKCFDELFPTNEIFTLIDTTKLSECGVAVMIAEIVKC